MTAGRKRNQVNISWLVEKFKEVFWEALSEEISNGEQSLWTVLISSGGLVVRGARSQERFYLSNGNIDTFFATNIPDQVSFKTVRLTEWAREAVAFYRQNSSHPEFSDIFANRLHYDVVIRDLLRFDPSTQSLKEYISKAGIRGTLLPDRYPSEFQQIISELALAAIRPTLSVIAHELSTEAERRPFKNPERAARLRKVQKEPSFQDTRGAVPFIVVDGRLAIGGTHPRDRADEYRELLQRAFKNLEESNSLRRLDNQDPDLVRLVREYEREAAKHSPSIVLLWQIGIDIERRIRWHQTCGDNECGLGSRELFYVESFMSAHNLFVQCFDVTANIIDDMERSAGIYMQLDAQSKTIPWMALATLGSNSEVVEDRSRGVIMRSSKALVEGHETKGLVAIGFGLLRGALHAMGGALVAVAAKVVDKAATEIGKEGLVDGLKSAGVYIPMISFIQNHVQILLHLSSAVPHYFGWLPHLIDILF
jgi:hypothetical protein